MAISLSTAIENLEALRADTSDFQTSLDTQPIDRYNAASGTRVLLLNCRNDGLHLDPIIWGYLLY